MIACLGPAGSFSHLLAMQVDKDVKLCDSISDVLNVVNENADVDGIVPLENSSGGVINETIDLLIRYDKNIIIKEILSLKVRLSLLGKKGSENGEVKEILSHAMPFFHCDEWLKEHYPKAYRISMPSTSAAAAWLAEHEHTEGVYAIGSAYNARQYGLSVIKDDIASDKVNMTEFYRVGQRKLEVEEDCNRTACVLTIKDEVGALLKVLKLFVDAGVNLYRIYARPGDQLSNHKFFLEFDKAFDQDEFAKLVGTDTKIIRYDVYKGPDKGTFYMQS